MKPRAPVRRFDVFAPTIKAHFDRGDSYQGIRDVVRKDWKPAR